MTRIREEEEEEDQFPTLFTVFMVSDAHDKNGQALDTGLAVIKSSVSNKRITR